MPKKQTIVVLDTGDLASRAVELFKAAAEASVERTGRFVVALSGGSTMRGMHRLLAVPPTLTSVPWVQTHLFWADERCVPAGDCDSNFGTAWKDMLRYLPLPRDNIHRVRGSLSPEEAAEEYELRLNRFFQLAVGEYPVFDLVVLGMGKDGHTASLFPGQRALYEETRLAVAVKGGSPDVHRVTLTYPVLNQARQIVFLVTGKEKAETLKRLDSEPELPAARIKPLRGDVTWLLDQEAASLLSNP
jgi:6-phosphogluconolactonase